MIKFFLNVEEANAWLTKGKHDVTAMMAGPISGSVYLAVNDVIIPPMVLNDALLASPPAAEAPAAVKPEPIAVPIVKRGRPSKGSS